MDQPTNGPMDGHTFLKSRGSLLKSWIIQDAINYFSKIFDEASF